MRLSFPSLGFDDAVAGVCHGSATEAEMHALNELLRSDSEVSGPIFTTDRVTHSTGIRA
jgi:hypothetical protein